MAVNIGSISQKINTYAKSVEGKRRMGDAISKIVKAGGSGRTSAGDIVVTRDQMIEAAQLMISLVKKYAASSGLPASVMQHVESFVSQPPIVNEDGSGFIAVFMADDASRPSLYPEKYDGAWNIVALFNNGYDASNVVYGRPSVEIEGQQSIDGFFYIKSRPHRDGLGFMQRAVEEFNMRYGQQYNVTASLGGPYG